MPPRRRAPLRLTGLTESVATPGTGRLHPSALAWPPGCSDYICQDVVGARTVTTTNLTSAGALTATTTLNIGGPIYQVEDPLLQLTDSASMGPSGFTDSLATRLGNVDGALCVTAAGPTAWAPYTLRVAPGQSGVGGLSGISPCVSAAVPVIAGDSYVVQAQGNGVGGGTASYLWSALGGWAPVIGSSGPPSSLVVQAARVAPGGTVGFPPALATLLVNSPPAILATASGSTLPFLVTWHGGPTGWAQVTLPPGNSQPSSVNVVLLGQQLSLPQSAGIAYDQRHGGTGG